MVRVLKGLMLGTVGVAVLASAAVLKAAQDDSGTIRGGRLMRVAQKSKTSKKKSSTANKKAMEDDAAATPDAEKKADDTPKPAAAASGADGLLFSRDIAPILVANCGNCHITPPEKKGDFDMSTFKKLIDGPKGDHVIEPGKPDDSNLVFRIKGGDKNRRKMPPGARNNLAEEAITKIEEWVKAGAVLDAGKDPNAMIASYAASVSDLRKFELAKMSPEERDKQVEKAGLDRWKRSAAKSLPEVTTGKHFLLFSNLPKTRADGVVKKMDDEYETVKGLLGPASVEWGEKGSLFVFNDVGHYGEFVQSNQQRRIEEGDIGTAQFSGPEPYVAVVDPLGGREGTESMSAPASRKSSGRSKRGKAASASEEANTGGPERTLAGLLTENFVIGAAQRAGKPPRWVTLGLGALVASQVEPGSPYYRKIKGEAVDVCRSGWQSKANEALGDQEQTPVVRAVGFALMDAIQRQNKRAIAPFVAAMNDGGAKLDEALGKVLNVSREDFLALTGEFVMAQYGR